jgi:hypothetical protein
MGWTVHETHHCARALGRVRAPVDCPGVGPTQKEARIPNDGVSGSELVSVLAL